MSHYLDKESDQWSAAEFQQAKNDFRAATGAPPAKLVMELYNCWIKSQKPRLFDGSDEGEVNDLGLLLHAQAYGIDVTDKLRTDLFAVLEKSWSASFCPPPLSWGPSAALSSNIVTAIDSTILQAWVFVESNPEQKIQAVQRILVIGRGLPQVRFRVFHALLMTSFRMPRKREDPADIFCDGVIQVTSPGGAIPIRGISVNFIGGAGATRLDATATVEGELRRVVSYLEELEAETGLIRIHKVERRNDKLLISSLREKARSLKPQEAIIWCPGEAAQEWTDISRYWRNGGKAPLYLALPPDILRSRQYQQLLQSYHAERIRSLLMDLYIRWELYREHELELLKGRIEWDNDWREAQARGENPEQFCLAKYGREVFVNIRFDSEFGRITYLRVPEAVPTLRYYLEAIPRMALSHNLWRCKTETTIRDYLTFIGGPASEGWLQGVPKEPGQEHQSEMTAQQRLDTTQPHIEAMKRVLASAMAAEAISEYSWKLDTPCARILASRFVDCALRNKVPPDLEGESKELFSQWAKSVRSMLLFEIRRELERKPSTYARNWRG
jgi:hypothetical protein